MNIIKNFIEKYSTHIQWILGTAALGTLTYHLTTFIRRQFSAMLCVSSRDEAYEWILYWLSEHPYTKSCKHVSLLGRLEESIFSNYHSPKEKHKTIPRFIPTPGLHFLKFQNSWIWIKYSQQVFSRSKKTENEVSYIYVGTLFGGNQKFLQQFLSHVQEFYLNSLYGKTMIYVADTTCETWEPRIVRPKRDPSTVILANGIYEKLLKDAKDFLQLKDWYNMRGIPFRRGYLLYGPPGTGKTSTILALAGNLDLNICTLNLSSKELTDDTLSKLLSSAPQNCIILLEDLHLVNREDGLTFSGLLNSIDGVVAQEGRLLFMTTNDIHGLPKALIRPGRVDQIVLIDYAQPDQCRRMFLSFYPNHEDLADEFVNSIPNNAKITTAALQGHFLKYRKQPKEAIENVKELFNGSVNGK